MVNWGTEYYLLLYMFQLFTVLSISPLPFFFFFFLPQAPKNPSKHEFLNREGVSQLYEAEGIIKQAPPTLGESPHIKR